MSVIYAVIRLCRPSCAGKSLYFIGTFGFSCATESTEVWNLRNNVAIGISDKRGSKCPKKPQNRPFLLGVAVHSDLRGDSMAPRLFLQQNRAWVIYLNLLSFSPIFALSRGIGVLGRSRSQISTQGILVAYTGIFTAERKKYWSGAFAIVDWITAARQWPLLYLSSFLLVISCSL